MDTQSSTPADMVGGQTPVIALTVQPQLLDAAQSYRELGLKPLPLDGKSPKVAKWPSRDLNDSELEAYLQQATDPGIGVQMGPSSGLIDVEWDSPEAQETFERLDLSRSGPAFKSNRGEHHLFKWDERLATCGAKATIEGLEFHLGGSGKGAQTAWPPTPGRNWLAEQAYGEQELPTLPDEVVELLVEKSVGKASGDAVHLEPEADKSEAELREIQSRLLELPNAVEGSRGSHAFFRACCEIARSRLNEEQAVDMVHWWNGEKCFPPFDPAEAARKWNEAKQSVYAERPGLFEEGIDLILPDIVDHGDVHANSGEPGALASSVIEVGATEHASLIPSSHLQRPSIQKLKFDLELKGVDDFCTQDLSQTFLIEDLLVASEHFIVGGPSKSFKTSIILDMCVALASGTPFLGHFEVPAAVPAMLITGESGTRTLIKRLSCHFRERGLDRKDYNDKLFIGERLPTMKSGEHMEVVGEAIAKHGVKFAMIDPAYLAALSGGDGSEAANMMAMGPILQTYSEIGRELDCTVSLCHHTRKTFSSRGGKYGQPSLCDLSHAGFDQWARQWLLTNHKAPFADGQASLWMKCGGSAGHGGSYVLDVNEGENPFAEYQWKTSVYPSHEAPAAIGEKEEIEQGIKTLLKFDGNLTQDEIRSAIGKNRGRVGKVLKSLVENGELTQGERKGGRGKAPATYSLATKFDVDEDHLTPDMF